MYVDLLLSLFYRLRSIHIVLRIIAARCFHHNLYTFPRVDFCLYDGIYQTSFGIISWWQYVASHASESVCTWFLIYFYLMVYFIYYPVVDSGLWFQNFVFQNDITEFGRHVFINYISKFIFFFCFLFVFILIFVLCINHMDMVAAFSWKHLILSLVLLFY